MSLVSIILPSYNHAKFLKKRLKSIQDQTFKDWELIIIDDCSSDESVFIINEFIKSHPAMKIKHFIVNETNSGSGYKSWQKGIVLAETDYIWLAETDDYSEPFFLEESLGILEKNSNIPLVFCTSNYVDENNKFLYDSRKRTSPLGISEDTFGVIKNEIIINSFPFNSFITNGSSVVFRKPITAIPVELFRNRQMSDLFLWTWLIQKQDIAFLNKKLNNFRRHADSTTTKIDLYQRETLYTEFVDYLNFYPNTKKNELLFAKFVKEYWIIQLKKGHFSIQWLRGLKNYNFFTLRTKLMVHLFRFVLSKLYFF
ncbi:glycosyltransferase [Flavobacterium sp. K5-23]|uniref:glycosyltransferase n=1 Tax=Flavobacterium sp. K5-23 TaxID=2746225 RepID=UPI00200F9736|nr:glycosyltransferase [Flavobacterium sp. K5-23]UQD56152.1 glycosyltransferase [Flavobacterium sp. K5-23]